MCTYIKQQVSSLRKDSVANYASISIMFSPSVKSTGCALQGTKCFVVIYVANASGATRFAKLRWKFSKT